MTDRQNVRIEYRIRPEVEIAQVEQAIGQFVTGIREHDADHTYTSYRDTKDARHFVHVGSFARAATANLQAQPFFKAFTEALRGWTVAPPDVTMLEPVASTR
jgi:quinol monooxygenase YgiN